MIPGTNLLNMALGLITPTTGIIYFRNTGRVANAKGVWIPTFNDGVPIDSGNAQPVPRNRFQNLGLDYQKNYITWFVPMSLVDASRDMSGDEIQYDGQRWKVESKTDWYSRDGWVYATLVQVS